MGNILRSLVSVKQLRRDFFGMIFGIDNIDYLCTIIFSHVYHDFACNEAVYGSAEECNERTIDAQ